jgi:Tfp pilus assembly protein PilO
MSLSQRLAGLPESTQHGGAIFGLLIAAAAAWWLIVKPTCAILAVQEAWRAENRQQLALTRASVAGEKEIREQLARIAGTSIWQRFYPSTDLASATIEDDLRSLCETSGVQLQELADLPVVEEQGLARLGQQLAMIATADSLAAFIAGLRDHPRYLRIERLAVSTPALQTIDAPPWLTVSMEVVGYRQDRDVLPIVLNSERAVAAVQPAGVER